MSICTLLGSRSAGAVARLLAAGVLVLAGCSPQRQLSQSADGQVFAHGLKDIGQLYLEPVSLGRVALSGATRLARLDNRLAINASAGAPFTDRLTLSYGSRDVASYAMPAGDDAKGWGALLANLVAAARAASPRLAALPPEQIDRAVFHGMTAALDPFSRYSGPEVARDQRAARDGFGGIGVTLDASDRQLRIAAVNPQGPAALAGLQPEDQIVAIDGIDTAGCSREEASHRLRGPIGSAVTLKIARADGTDIRDLSLRRAFVTMPTVTLTRDGDVAVLRISGFNRSTARHVAAAVAQTQQETGGRLSGIVLDLRGNPGGLLDQAVDLADLFIPDGPIVSTVGRHPASYQYFAAKGDSIAPHLPIAVLINGRSASASEIVAAALQDAGRAVVIGSSSYGKGTVQTVLHLPNNGDLIVTWAKLVTRSGYLLQHHGVVPTLCTALLPDDAGPFDVRLQQAAAASFAAGPRPRAALDERGWAGLRQSCPPRRTRPAIDLRLAERLLHNPTLYAEALHAMPAVTRVAQGAAAVAPPAPALTDLGRALSSPQALTPKPNEAVKWLRPTPY